MKKSLLHSLIKEAQINLINNPQDYAHEITHHYRTWLTAKEIFSGVEEPFNMEIVELICWWHDVQVLGLDYDGRRICHVVAEYLSSKIEKDEGEIISDSIKQHEFDSTPKFTEGKILQDADKLEILSDERFRLAINAVEAGLMGQDYFNNVFLEVYDARLPKMPGMYNFDISRKIHKDRLKILSPKIEHYRKSFAAPR